MSPNDAVQLVSDVLARLGIVTTRIEYKERIPHPFVVVEGPDSALLIGQGGENLRALNHVIKKIAEKKFGGSECIVDVNGYHERKIHEIENSAKMLAERVRVFRADVEMPPMNPYERMVVHTYFTDDPEIKTESLGEGKFRRVVLKFKGPLTF